MRVGVCMYICVHVCICVGVCMSPILHTPLPHHTHIHSLSTPPPHIVLTSAHSFDKCWGLKHTPLPFSHTQIDKCFGFETSFTEAQNALMSAKVEARSNLDGIGLVKLMGRQSGFIAVQVGLLDVCLGCVLGVSWVCVCVFVCMNGCVYDEFLLDDIHFLALYTSRKPIHTCMPTQHTHTFPVCPLNVPRNMYIQSHVHQSHVPMLPITCSLLPNPITGGHVIRCGGRLPHPRSPI